MQYSYALFSDVVTALAARLYDPTKQQWTDAELQTLLIDSLRTWNALSQFWRDTFSFTLTTGQWWYDLRTVSGTLLPYSVTKYEVVTNIKRHLLEPSSPTVWGGSDQYSFQDIWSACQRRQDETLGQTACTIVRSTVTAPVVAGAITLGDSTIDIRRVAWLPSSGYSEKVMTQSDVWASRAFEPGYPSSTPKPPTKWMQNTDAPPSFSVDTIPPVVGNYDVLTTEGGPAWSSSDGTLTIPNDWVWVFQFGAMADLFSRESNASDALRAAYCRARYQEGLALMRMQPVLLAAKINGVPLGIGAVTGADKFNPSWMSAAASTPKSIYTFMNLMAVSPKPNATVYTAAVTVCKNAPVADAYIQVAKDDLDTIIDYAQHLAMLKQGGEEFYKSIALYQNMQKKAANYNGKLREMGFFEMPQLDLATLDENRNPRFQKGSAPTA